MQNRFYKFVGATILVACAWSTPSFAQKTEAPYIPSQENLAAREQFQGFKFGIFLHWGIYSSFAQGEWYLQNADINRDEYAKAASAFYPHLFNANDWVAAIKDAGAKYITFTTRHHDGFSMWDTDESDYNIVKATPFKRDVVKELADACHAQNIALHLYYSHIDWTRDDYPMGRTGRGVGKDTTKADWPHYYDFMNRQLTELLTRYGKIGAIWFDGHWDRDEDPVPFDWQLRPQYDMIHALQPSCLVGNNHHIVTYPGEDIQIFERDIPGQNTAGLSGQSIGRLPLETCQTMNGMWGYKVVDQNYKSSKELIQYLVSIAGLGANLLLNIGPQPNGELPATALQRLKEMGVWMRQYGNTLYESVAGDVSPQPWGVTTRKGDTLFVHVLHADSLKKNKAGNYTLSLNLSKKVEDVQCCISRACVPYKKNKKGITVELPDVIAGDEPDYIFQIMTK